ncbi:MAG TPA: cell division protein SepF [Candidatus Hungatella pullicola]|nr:cell division protein SepF [Candidatus Hungatella pullicola]
MSILGKLMDSMRLNDTDDEDYYLDDDYDGEEEKPARRSLFSKKNEEDYYEEDEYEQKPRIFSRPSPKVVPMKRTMEVSMIKPTTIEDAKEICDYMLSGKAVVLNMEGIHTEVAQRIIDFTCGATYSMNGNLQKISNYIFIATPESVELSGDFQDLLNSGTLDMGGMNLRL